MLVKKSASIWVKNLNELAIRWLIDPKERKAVLGEIKKLKVSKVSVDGGAILLTIPDL